jgi:hypothetical protein
MSPDLVRRGEELDLVLASVVDSHLLTDAPHDAVLRELGVDMDRGLVVDEVAVDHRLAVAVDTSAKVCRLSIRVSLNAFAACSPRAERSTRNRTRRKRRASPR